MSTTEDAVCLASGIALDTCRPSDDLDRATHPTGACHRPGLECYRTDLLGDEGVCTTMKYCDGDSDCPDPVRSVCATTFLADLYPRATDLKRDHLHCLQRGCKARGTSCSPGETCLQEVVPASAHPPDICVPNCDSKLRCPPNFLCYRKVSTAVTPNVCIPGLLGFTCLDSIDCMLGSCVDNGIKYKVCTTDVRCRGGLSTVRRRPGKVHLHQEPGQPDRTRLLPDPRLLPGLTVQRHRGMHAKPGRGMQPL